MLRTIFRLRPPFTPINPSSSSSTLSLTVPTPPQFLPLPSYFSNSPILEKEHLSPTGDPDPPPRLFVVQPRIRPEIRLKAKLDEALNLANSLEQQRDGFYETEFLDKAMPPHLVVQNPLAKSPRADTYFGVGTVGTIKCNINHLETKVEVDAVFVNAILSGVQQRNLERVWEKPVLDRVGLIIEIFNAHARTKEAKLQAELAALMYKRSRLVRVRGPDGRFTFGGVGEAEVVSARGRGSGGQGFISGAGETELQLQRRRISERRIKLLSEIKDVRRTRAVQRAARKRQGVSPGQEIATVAVVGYTNAGKSTLASALSDKYHYCDDRMFATVDPKLSSVILPSGRKVLLSDTVGFISDLPVELVEAFKATLEEVVEADLLVHVLDSSAPNLDEHRETVMQVLEKIGVPEEKLRNMIEVWNKVDILEEKSDEDYGSGFSGGEEEEEDGDVASDEVGNEEDIYSDGWITCDDEEGDAWVDSDGKNIGCEIVNGKGNEVLVGAVGVGGCGDRPESTCHVKTSAVSGVGLQELLEIIDEKVGPSRPVERGVFDRKWRPPRREEDNNEIAVGHT